MNFEFTSDQRMIGEQANNFLQKECSSEVVRSILDTDSTYDSKLWRQIAELGWMGVAIPEEYGGLGLSYFELALIAEAMGRALAPIPFSTSVYLTTEILNIAGSKAIKQKWLPKLAAGEVIGTAAIKDSLTLNSKGNLNGELTLVPDAGAADICIVQVKQKYGASLYLLELDQPFVEIVPAKSIDPSRPFGNIICNNARAKPIQTNIGNQALLEDALKRAAVLYAWEQIGGSDAALEQARDYALQRFAFGRSIASFQAIKHKLAEGYVKNTMARSNGYHAIWALNSKSPKLATAAPIARISAIQAYYYMSKENIQTHGGMGFTWEFDCHLHYRRAKSLSLVIGGGSEWKKRLVRKIIAGEELEQ